MTTEKSSVVQCYLFFNGQCEEALAFYGQAVGAHTEFLMRYKESPEPAQPGRLPAGFENKIMHASFRIGQTVVMASDGCSTNKSRFDGFSLSISAPTAADAERAFAALAQGGTVQMPLAKTFWSPLFGMLEDRFGISWMVSVTPG